MDSVVKTFLLDGPVDYLFVLNIELLHIGVEMSLSYHSVMRFCVF